MSAAQRDSTASKAGTSPAWDLLLSKGGRARPVRGTEVPTARDGQACGQRWAQVRLGHQSVCDNGQDEEWELGGSGVPAM